MPDNSSARRLAGILYAMWRRETPGGRLYVFGGEAPGVFPHNEEYDPARDSWRRVADMPTPRPGLGAATVGNVIYVIGGGTEAGFGASTANERYTPPR